MHDYLSLANKATTPKELGRFKGKIDKNTDCNDLAWRLSDWRNNDFDLWYDRIQHSVVFSVGDYDNDTVHRANEQSIQDIFKDELARGKYIWESYCIMYTKVYIVHEKLFLKLADEVLYPLSRYPLLDDQLHSDIEYKDFEEAITDESQSYWRREVEEEHITQDKFESRVWAELRKPEYENNIYPGEIAYDHLQNALKNVHRSMKSAKRTTKRRSMRDIIKRAAQSWLF